MEIRKKLTFQFIVIVAVILLISSTSIYLSFSGSREEEFYNRLESKAKLTGQMLIEIDEIDTGLLDKIEQNNPLSLPNEKILIYDYENKLTYTNDNSFKLNRLNELFDIIRLNGHIRFKQGQYEMLGYFYTSPAERIVVFVGATDIFGLQKLIHLRNTLIVVFILALVIVFISARIFSARALKPVARIIDQVNGITATKLNERVDEGNGKDELARLALTFNQMLERLEIAFKIQKNFIANASHELRTPLTVITGQLEVVLMNPRSISEYKNALESVLEDIQNLNHISNRLLLLAQTDSHFFDKEFMTIRIDEAIWQARHELLKRNKKYKIFIDFDDSIDDDEKLKISGNIMLLKTAFSNLFENACKYSMNQQANVLIRSKGKNTSIEIIDTGIGIPEAEKAMIFQPFYRAHNTSGISGHGVGLSIVDKIIQLHLGKINVESTIGQGSIFTVILPVSF